MTVDTLSSRPAGTKLRGCRYGTVSMNTPDDRIAWYRERDSDCWERAKTAPDEHSRAMLEDMAAKWERLVILIESGKVN